MTKPAPRVTRINRQFFDGCNRDELLLQRCLSSLCHKFVFYPRVACPRCSAPIEWARSAGRGRIVSFSKIHRPQHESFFPEVPYYFIAVELDEGPLMFSRLSHQGPLEESGLIGRTVRAVFMQHTSEQRLPFFELS